MTHLLSSAHGARGLHAEALVPRAPDSETLNAEWGGKKEGQTGLRMAAETHLHPQGSSFPS